MSSNSETGNAKNIANFNALNEINNGFGGSYAPSNPLAKLTVMEAQYTDCNAKQIAVNAQNGVFKPIDNARKIEFTDVKPLSRRIRSSAKGCGAGNDFYNNVSTAVNKLLGVRISKATPTAADPAGTSASQLSFDNVTNNFEVLLELVSNQPLYAPNEADLQVAALNTKYTAMDTSNNAVKAGVVPYNNAVIARNRALYATTTGLCDVGQASKDYLRSVYAVSSPEFKMVSRIQFKKMVSVD